MVNFVVSLYLGRESGGVRELNPVLGDEGECWESGFKERESGAVR